MRSTMLTAAAIGSLLLPLTCLRLAAQGVGDAAPALRGVPADAPNVLIVRDVMPHVEALLRSPALREAASASGDLQQELFGMQFDPATLERQLGLLSAFVPRQIEVACSEDLSTSIAQLLHALTAMAIGDVASADDRLLMGTEVQAALQALVAPTGIVRVTARDERTAEQWFDQLLDLIENLAAGVGEASLTVTVGDARVDLAWRPFAKLNGDFSRMIARMQVEAESFADLELRAVLSQSDAELTLRMGEFEGTDLAAAKLGELFRANDSQLLFANLESTDALEVGYRTLDLLFETEMEAESAMVMQLYAAVDQFTDLADHSSAAFDLADGATWTLLLDYGEELFEFERPEPEIVRCIDPALGPFMLSALTLDLMLSATGDEIYNRVLQRADEPQADEAFAMLDRFEGLFDYIDGEDSAVFLPGTAFVSAPSSFRGLSRVRPGSDPAADPAADPDELLPQLPFAAIAVVAKADSAAAANTFVDTLVARSCDGLGVRGDGALVEADLGLGVPTRRLAFAQWLPAGIKVDADFDPHHAQLDEVMILSTDPALTRQLLARLRGSTAPRLPVTNPIEWSRWRGAQFSALIGGMGAWFGALPPDFTGDGMEEMARTCRTLATLSESIETLETLSVLEADGRMRETSTMKLRNDGK